MISDKQYNKARDFGAALARLERLTPFPYNKDERRFTEVQLAIVFQTTANTMTKRRSAAEEIEHSMRTAYWDIRGRSIPTGLKVAVSTGPTRPQNRFDTWRLKGRQS